MTSPEPFALSLFGIALMCGVLIFFVGAQRTGQRGVRAFIFLTVSLGVWAAGYGLELLVPTLAAKALWVKVEYVGISTIGVAVLLFALDYSGHSELTRPGYVAGLLVVPLMTVVLALSFERHDLLYRTVQLDHSAGFPVFSPTYGSWFWVNWVYNYLLLVVTLAFLVAFLRRVARLYRRQAIIMLLGLLAPWMGNALYVTGANPFPFLDLTPYGFAITCGAMGWALLRLHLLDISPTANVVVVENMLDAVIVLDRKHRIVGANASARALLGEDREALIGQPIADVLPGLPAGRGDPAYEVSRAEIEFAPEGKPLLVFETSRTALRNASGVQTGAILVLHDITGRKQVEVALVQARDQALRANELKSRVVATISHDFRTPLSAILGFAEVLEHEVNGPLNEKQRASATRIIERAEQLVELVNVLLAQSELDSGKFNLNLQPFEPARLAQSLSETLETHARQKGLALNVSVDGGVPQTLVGDVGRLRQVAMNLLANALKFTEEGQVSMRFFRADEARWGFEVADTGIGLSPQDRARIFDAFWQVESPSSLERKGIGLGLSIVKELVTMMEGTVVVESEPGKGTHFIVTLPLLPLEG